MNMKKFWKETKHMLALVLAVALFFNGWSNYDFSVLAADELTVSLSADSAVYTGGNLKPDIKSVKDASDAAVDFTQDNVTWKNSAGNVVTEIIDSGTYTVTVKVSEQVDDGSGNISEEIYTGTANFAVNTLDLSACTVTADNVKYTGTAIAPKNVVVKLGENQIDSSLYTIEDVSNNTNAGTATFAVNPVGSNSNVTGNCSGSFNIEKKNITDKMVTISPEAAIVNENGIDSSKISVTVKDIVNGTETELTKDSDYTVKVPAEIKNQGTYDVEVSGIGNYNGIVSKTITLSYAKGGTASLDGNTLISDLEDKVYADAVTVRPAKGYEIAEESQGSYAETITYTATPTDFVVYLKNTSTKDITEYVLPTFTVDAEAPVFNQVTAPAVDSDWAEVKEIVLDVPGADYIYYTTEEASLGNLISEKPTDMTQLQGNTLQVKENISAETTYYFYAIDKAGHVASAEAKVSKVDIDKPVISVDNAMDNFVDGVYWKNADNLEIPVGVTDNLSGIKSIEVTGGNLECPISADKLSADGTLTITEAGTYTITATDGAGTEATKTITVKQDTKAPEVALLTPIGENMYFDSSNQVYWFSGEKVSVPLNITDALGTDQTEKAPYTVVHSTSEDMSNPTEVTVNDNDGKVAFTVGTKTTYYFQVADKAGNKGTIQSVTLAYDDSKPEITAAELTQLSGDTWINAEEFGGENSEHKVAFSVTAKDAESGIQKIEYSSDNGEHYTKASFNEENGTYTFVTNEEYADGTGYQWKVRVTNNVGKDSDGWTFVDTEGNNLGQIDTVAPSATAYIRFISDTAGANDTDRGSVADDKWTSKIYEIASTAWNKIWGKTTVTFEVYVQDVISGIADISMSYNGADIQGLTKVTGLKAFTEGADNTTDASSNATGYTVYRGKITCNEKEDMEIKDFRIDSLTDIAGNTTSEKVVLNSAENTGIIYLDNVSPKLVSVEIDGQKVVTEERYLYSKTKKVTLTIEERFFGQENNPVYPRVIVNGRKDGQTEFKEISSTKAWTKVEGQDYQWQATVELPLNAEQEWEYQVMMEAYRDPSGNVLEGINGVAANGSFLSKILVVDAAAPKLTNYSVSTPTACSINGATVYKNDAEITVEFTIDDNATDYEKSKDNLVINVYNAETEESVLELTENELSKISVNGRSHTYSFTYTGESDSSSKYYVEITYKDAVGLPLENAAGLIAVDGKEGTYKSNEYIIDHVAPVFDISYSNATRIVKEGVDGEGQQPLAGYTAYYNQDIVVTYTFDEKYSNIKEDGSLDHYEFKITKDGNELTGDSVPKIIWTKPEADSTIHKMEFTISANEEHLNDGNYQFVIKYRDCAENVMVGNEDNADLENLMSIGSEESTNVSVSIYTSPVLVMDTTAPIVTTSYSSRVTRTDDEGRDYFDNTNAIFNIEVVDRNIRHGELKTVLADMSAYNVDGKAISNSQLATDIKDIKDATVQCIEGNADPVEWNLELPLSTEANYEIPVSFTDLAGNKAIVNEAGERYEEYVTVDKTPVNENIYIDFESDVKGANDLNIAKQESPWYSEIVEFVSNLWNKIWGREIINFKVYVRDEISGVDSLTMVYNADGKKVTLSSSNEKLEEPAIAMITIGSEEYKYVVYSGKLELDDNAPDLEISQFQIKEVVDKATNPRGPLWFAGTEKNKQIYLDKTSPEVVSVKIGDESVTEDEIYFYNEEQTVTLTIEERFFGQEDTPVYPEVIVSSKTTGGADVTEEFEKDENLSDLSTSTWTPVDGTNQWQATVSLPKVDGAEIEYQIAIEGYQDAAENPLKGVNVDKGNFTSKTFVIDNLAPKLTSYSVNKPTECMVDGAAVYKNDTENADLTVEFAIDDNEAYYEAAKENLVAKVYKNDETEPVYDTRLDTENTTLIETTDLKNAGRVHTYSFSYDGDKKDVEDQFHVEIGYEDAAGNLMIDGREEPTEGTKPGTLAEGVYRSEDYIIDHVAPIFNIKYSDATNLVNTKGENEGGNQPLAGYTAYYNKDIVVTYTFDEKYANIKEDGSLDHYEFKITKDGKELTGASAPEITWTKPEGDSTIHTMEFTIPANPANKKEHINDGNYQFVIKYRDCAENAMVAEKDADGNLVNPTLKDLMSVENDITGVYTSPVLVMDTTAPEVTTTYTSKVAQTYNHGDHSRDYFNTMTGFNITVVDRNIRYSDLITKLHDEFTAQNIKKESLENAVKVIQNKLDEITKKDQKIQCVNGNVTDCDSMTWKVELPLTEEANYNLPIYFTDLAGNKAQVTPAGAENQIEEGYIEYVTVDTQEPGLELSYSISDPANYLKWGYWFAKGQMNIKVTAEDIISGVQYIKFTVYDENEKVIKEIPSDNFKLDKADKTQFSIDIPLSTRDFKGSIKAEVFDYSKNEKSQRRGHIIESAERHSSTGKAVIQTITSPSRTVGGIDFYNTDVKFKLTLEDTYSGLASWKYVGGDTLEDTHSYKKDAGTDMEKDPTQEITYSYVEELTLNAAGNNKNDVLVTASYVDNVGHTNEVEQKYNIDITKPEIEVTYDLNEPANEKYYKETRTATVKIRERNFDPADVEFLITSTDGPKPEISGWSSSGTDDNTYHTCTVAFSQDSDYTFTLKFQDMAGNVADYNRVDEFTIDKTIPEATITYDNNNFLNEYYYDAARTATIDILEHNFDPTAIDIMVTADGGTAGVPHISAWSSNGDHNIATITFSADAEYTFDIAGLDLALNELEDYTLDHFVIDQTAPELEIFDIENMSANNGVVRPGIRYYDTNYDKDGTVIQMTGYHNGVVEMTGERKLEANGLELKLNDFEYVQEMDDIYTMQATVYDLAGNSSEENVMFSVNRFGSVYTFDEKTDALIGDHGKYYTNQEQELVITETNVDTLEFKEITCNLNGKLTTLKEGEDYTVSLNGNEATWKQYTYTLKEDNFAEEGTYILTIYSEDRATNTSDNSSKGKKIEFVVDKTNPSVLISGIENNGQYRTNSREMTLDIEDNVRLSQVAVTIDGTETVYDAAQIQEADGKFVMNIGSANHWQDIEIAVTDAAGNEEISEEMRVLVTANIFVQYFMNKPIFYGSLGTLAATAALLWWFLVGKKKKENEEAK